MLEYTLIKQHRPPFNVVFRDDKRYPYIKITTEDFPRVILTRRVENDGGIYFGPYVSGWNVRRILDMVHRFFKIRTCRRTITEDKKNPPLCLLYHIKRCDGPCESLISRADYAAQVGRAERFLRGDYDGLISELRRGMQEAAGERRFELAAIYRDRVAAIHELSEKQRAATARAVDLDAVAFVSDPNRGRICFYVFKIRNGHIIGNAGFVFPFAAADEPEALSQFLTDYYRVKEDIPAGIAISVEPAHHALLARWLSERAGHRVAITRPKRGHAFDLVRLAEKNARARLYEKADPEAEELLDRVRDKLQLARRPECIHGHDVANLGPAIVTGARVVFSHGKPEKSFYRAYGLETSGIKDDYRAMEELVRRSFKRAVEGEQSAMPDLLLIDGGLGHVHAARKALADVFSPPKSTDAPVRRSILPTRHAVEIVGLAKENEILVLEDGKMIKLAKSDPVLNLFQRVRDEAHRFSRRLMSVRARKKMLERG